VRSNLHDQSLHASLDAHCFSFELVGVGSETLVVVIALKILAGATTPQVEDVPNALVRYDIPLRFVCLTVTHLNKAIWTNF
jgi:hypothetical protein